MTDPVESDLQIEILKSERLRAGALATLMAFLAVLTPLALSLPDAWNPLRRLVGGAFPVRSITAFYAAAFLYELGARKVLRDAIERRSRPPEVVRFVNALVETSWPTVVLAMLSLSLGPEIAFHSPLPMLYFLFISLSILRLAAPLSVFTGGVAGIEFVALGCFFFPTPDGGATFFNSLVPIVAKGAAMIMAGLVAGFVARELRRRLVASLRTEREKDRVIGMFGQYVTPSVVEQLLTQPVGGKGELRHVTILFLDVRNFTAFAEQRKPEEVVDYLNALFGTLIAIVNANHGIINKFLGDGFMACFGAPLSDGRDTENAVRAAMEIARAIESMNAGGAIPPTRVGIGLHAGPVVTGSVGSEERKEYALIGDTVNVASRVEQLTKEVGCTILATDAVWRVVKDEYPARAIAPVTVKGRTAPVAVYSLM